MRRYSGIKTISNPQDNNGAKFYSTVKYPQVPLSENDIYVLTGETDRLDLLASQFYGDSSLWWIIASANNNVGKDSIVLEAGLQIRIPSNPSLVLDLYKKINL
jgi:phage tail protein X